MKLTRYTDYSLRVMMMLAADPERTWTIQEIADSFGISKNHLMKVAYALGQAGRVMTVRGRGGGLGLAQPADEIRLGDLIRECEQEFILVDCGGEEDTALCALMPGCKLKNVLAEAMREFFSVLDRYTLADLIRSREIRARLLSLSGSGA